MPGRKCNRRRGALAPPQPLTIAEQRLRRLERSAELFEVDEEAAPGALLHDLVIVDPRRSRVREVAGPRAAYLIRRCHARRRSRHSHTASIAPGAGRNVGDGTDSEEAPRPPRSRGRHGQVTAPSWVAAVRSRRRRVDGVRRCTPGADPAAASERARARGSASSARDPPRPRRRPRERDAPGARRRNPGQHGHRELRPRR